MKIAIRPEQVPPASHQIESLDNLSAALRKSQEMFSQRLSIQQRDSETTTRIRSLAEPPSDIEVHDYLVANQRLSLISETLSAVESKVASDKRALISAAREAETLLSSIASKQLCDHEREEFMKLLPAGVNLAQPALVLQLWKESSKHLGVISMFQNTRSLDPYSDPDDVLDVAHSLRESLRTIINGEEFTAAAGPTEASPQLPAHRVERPIAEEGSKRFERRPLIHEGGQTR